VVRRLDAENVALATFELHAPTLDDVFLSKTGERMADDAPAPEGVAA
jgi:ABC-type uncharacterized transport system ATPase subunit